MKKTHFKKAFSIFMACMMLLSCWVWVAPTKADAATVSFPITIRFSPKTSNPSGHINVYYFPWKADNSGFDTSQTNQYTNVINSYTGDGYANNGTTYNANFNITQGWPWKVEIRVQSGTVRFLGFFINGVETTGMVANNNEGYDIKGAITKHWAYNDNDNLSSGSIANKNWSVSVPTSITSMANIDATIPSLNSPNTLYYTRTATVTDQYGVTWPVPADYKLSTSLSSSGSAPGTGVSYDAGGNGYSNGVRVYVTEQAQKLKTNTSSSTYYLFATKGNLQTYATINLTHPTYTVRFNDADGNSIQSTNTHVYGSRVTPPANPSKAPDSANHYSFMSWDSTAYEFVEGDTVINPTYSGTSHSFTGAYVYNGDGTHSRKCTSCVMTGPASTCSGVWTGGSVAHNKTCGECGNVETHTPNFAEIKSEANIKENATCTTGTLYYKSCSICGRKSGTETFYDNDVSGHVYEAVSTTPHTCDQDGYTTYDCANCDATYNEYYVLNADGTYATDANGDKILADPKAHTWADKLSDKGEGYHGKVCTACNDAWTEVDEHTWTLTNTDSDPTCTEDGSADYECTCGATNLDVVLPATNHKNTTAVDRQDSTCTQIGYEAGVFCNDCNTYISGHAEIPMVAHKLAETAYNGATCETDGNIAYWTCSECGKIFSDAAATDEIALADTIIPALDHDYVATVTKEATCISDGVKTYTCKNDPSHNYTEAITATGEHVYGDWEQFNKGITHRRYCVSDINCSVHEEGDHSFSGDLYPAADLIGYHQYECEKCDALGANMSGKPVLNGLEECYGEGVKFTNTNSADGHTATCVCGNTKTMAHRWAGWLADPENKTDDNGQMTNSCLDCGYTTSTTCTYKVDAEDPASCTESGYRTWKCSECDNGYTEILSPLNHNGTLVQVDAKEATCTDIGWDAYEYCTACDYTTYNETSAKNHNGTLVQVGAKEATCTDIGWDAYEYCTACDYTTYVEIPAFNHDWSAETGSCGNCGIYCDHAGVTGATCSTAVTCDVCGYDVYDYTNHEGEYVTVWYNDDNHVSEYECCHLNPVFAPHNYKNFTITSEADCENNAFETGYCICGIPVVREIPDSKLGHDKVTVPGYAATCTESGLTDGVVCEVCDEVLVEQTIIPATNHVGTLVQVDEKEATCTDIGWDAYEYCTACDYTTYNELPATNHEGTLVQVDEKEATCTDIGWDAYEYCTACDYTTYNEISAKNHHGSLIQVDEKEATCTDIGWDAYEYCTACDYTTYVEIPATNHADTLIQVDAKEATCTDIGWDAYEYCTACDYTTYNEISAKNHNGTLVQVGAKEATCTEIGWDAYEYCTACDYTTYNELPATNHEGTLVQVEAEEATCTDIGWDAYEYCTACDYTTYAEKAALDHDYVDHEGKAATCTEDGWKAYQTCSRCDYTTYEKIDAIRHEGHLVAMPGKAATCMEDGYTEYMHCANCNADIGKKVIAAIGHVDENDDGDCDNCGKDLGTHSDRCGCICHKDNLLMHFLFKIINFFWKLFKIGKSCECGNVHY